MIAQQCKRSNAPILSKIAIQTIDQTYIVGSIIFEFQTLKLKLSKPLRTNFEPPKHKKIYYIMNQAGILILSKIQWPTYIRCFYANMLVCMCANLNTHWTKNGKNQKSAYKWLHDYLEGLNNFWNLFYAPQAPGLVAPFEK